MMTSNGERQLTALLKDSSDKGLLLSKDLSKDALLLLLKLLSKKSGTDSLLRLYAVFGREILLFLSLFEGESVRVPPMSVLGRYKEMAQIYEASEKAGFSEEALKRQGKIYSRKKAEIEGIVQKVDKLLEGKHDNKDRGSSELRKRGHADGERRIQGWKRGRPRT